jgi:hypothetical protein
MNFYVYVIRFIDGYYYYGYHPIYGNDPQFDQYYGTPVTHTEKWLTTMYWKEIISLHETFEEADAAEQSWIKPCYKTDPFCLNENCGGAISPDLCRVGGIRGGQTNKESGQAYEWGKKYGRIAVESGQLAEARSKINWETHAERTLEVKKQNGRKAVESGQFAEAQKKAIEATRLRFSVKDEDGKSIIAKEIGKLPHTTKDEGGKSVLAREMALKAHLEKDENGKSILAVSNGKKAGKLPWWYHPETGENKRQYESPGEGWEQRRGPLRKNKRQGKSK